MLPDGRFFTVEEFRCKDGTPYPFQWENTWKELISLCDTIREDWTRFLLAKGEIQDAKDGSIVVVCGYRTPKYNAELIAKDAQRGSHGVASGSQHCRGKAADLRPTHGSLDDFHIMILQEHERGGLPMLGGIGIYPESNWVHVDTYVLPDGHLRTWTGV
jgi:uncharacterized protein YcbK (DUF882 family)